NRRPSTSPTHQPAKIIKNKRTAKATRAAPNTGRDRPNRPCIPGAERFPYLMRSVALIESSPPVLRRSHLRYLPLHPPLSGVPVHPSPSSQRRERIDRKS